MDKNTLYLDTVEKKQYSKLKKFHFSKLIRQDFPKKKTKGLIFGNFGARNYGDEAILDGQLKELSKVKNCHLQIISRYPESMKKGNIKTIGLINILDVIKAVCVSDFLIIGGGGLFCKNDRGFMGIIFQLYMIALFFMLPMLLQKKIYVLGIGFYKNTNPVISFIARLFLKKTEIVTVRDAHSYIYLHSQGISAKLYKDNSYLMELLPVKSVLRDTFIKTKFNPKKFNVGIAIKKTKTKGDSVTLIDALKKFITVNTEDTDFWIFPLDNHTGDNDRKIAEEISISLKKNNNIHIMPASWSPNKLFSTFQLMDYFIAMRFHGLLFAYRCNVPMYGLTYDEKCTSFLESIGKQVIESKDASAIDMQQAFNKIKEKRKKITV